jgi:signal-transduction protein with cAMP-binding, CBS, and nucleotidyltransferase domain
MRDCRLAEVLVRDLMTQSVVVADPHSTVREIAELMRDRGVGSVVLVTDGRPVGFITDRDLAICVIADGRDASDRASDHASTPVITADPDMEVDEGAHVMIRQGVRRLVVVEAGFLVGVVTLDDLASRLTDDNLSARLSARITRAAMPDFGMRVRVS